MKKLIVSLVALVLLTSCVPPPSHSGKNQKSNKTEHRDSKSNDKKHDNHR